MTNARLALEQLAGRRPEEIDPDIVELTAPVNAAHYDRIARVYDAVLGTKIYNRFMGDALRIRRIPRLNSTAGTRRLARREHGPAHRTKAA